VGNDSRRASLALLDADPASGFEADARSGVYRAPLSEPTNGENASCEITTPDDRAPADRWREPRYVQLDLEGHALCASEELSAWLSASRLYRLAEAVRRAHRAQRVHTRIDGADVVLVRMVHPTGLHYLAVVTRPHSAPGVRRQMSDMQRKVARLAARGDTSGEIGRALGISANTVKFHLKRVYDALGVCNRVELKAALETTDPNPA
jgi:DNA-binding CsgD family transcriptional regulator